jgi:hypothetical protein
VKQLGEPGDVDATYRNETAMNGAPGVAKEREPGKEAKNL